MCKHFYNDFFKLIFDNLYNTPVSSLNINYYYKKNKMYYELKQFSSKLEGKNNIPFVYKNRNSKPSDFEVF